MNDTHSPNVGGIGFVISSRCSYKIFSSEFITTMIGKLVFGISRRQIHILSIYALTAIEAHSNETMYFYNSSLQLSMLSQHSITFSYVVTKTNHCLSIKFVSKTDVVKLIVTLRCSNHLLSTMTCLLLMRTQGKNIAHFLPLMDKMSIRHGLIIFSALFIIELTSRNPMHLGHL